MNSKMICADMVFHHPHDMQAFCRMHNVKRLLTGPQTLWPNRAEMGVRLFKKLLPALVDTASKKSGPNQDLKSQFAKKAHEDRTTTTKGKENCF